MNKEKILAVGGLWGVFLLSSVASYFIFSSSRFSSAGANSQASGASGTGTKPKIDLSEPKTEVCPLNGEKYTVSERQAWEKRRPIAAMIENHVDARPLSGLSRSDVVYEAVAEGGITRQLAIYYCAAQAKDITLAPIRSARIYFVKFAQEYGDRPIYVHVGGANAGAGETAVSVRALEYLETIGWRVPQGNDFDTTFDTGFPTLTQNPDRLGHEVAIEHRMTTSTERVWAQALKRKFTNVAPDGTLWNKTFQPWLFKDGAPLDQRGSLSKISFGFWQGAYQSPYNVDWTYDKQSNSFARTNGGQDEYDHENNERITAKNVVIEFAVEKGPLDPHMHMWYGIEGKGKAIVFQDGKAISALWEKDGSTSRTIYTDAQTGKEIPFVRGRIWIEVLPLGNKVSY